MKAIGVDTRAPTFTQCNFYTAHECLLLPYEQALTRQDSITDRWYGCSAHMLWIGERTRQLDHAHVHFCSGIHNPIGVKISDKCTPEELLTILDTVNPDNIPGKVTIVVRMGAEKLREKLPTLIRAVQVRLYVGPCTGLCIGPCTGPYQCPFLGLCIGPCACLYLRPFLGLCIGPCACLYLRPFLGPEASVQAHIKAPILTLI